MITTVPPRRREPGAPGTEPITFRIPIPLLARLRRIAKDEDRSLNAQVVRALREWLDKCYTEQDDATD